MMALLNNLPFKDIYWVPLDRFIKFESDMVKNSGISIFQKSIETVFINENFVVLQFQNESTHKSIKELLELDFFHLNHRMQLLKSLINLEKQCVAHLLETNHIDFNPTNVYYDMQLQEYVWRYIPCHLPQENYKMVDLVRHVLIESSFELIGMFTGLLIEKTFNLEALYKAHQSQPTTKNSQSTFIKHLFKRKQVLEEPLTKHTTLHNHTYPILLNKYDPSESYKLYFELNTIGRDEECNIYINSSSISRKHAVLFRENQQYKVKDLSSTNGTLLNKVPLSSEMIIVNGDNLQIGEKEFIFIR